MRPIHYWLSAVALAAGLIVATSCGEKEREYKSVEAPLPENHPGWRSGPSPDDGMPVQIETESEDPFPVTDAAMNGPSAVAEGEPLGREEAVTEAEPDRTGPASLPSRSLPPRDAAGGGDGDTDTRDLGPAAQNEPLPPPTPKRGASRERAGEPGFSTADASTFAIDVDSGAWAFARQALRNGRRPDPQAVRVEEFINAFRYRYTPPEGDAPMAWDAAYVPCPWNPAHGLLRVGLQAREVSAERRPPLNLVLLIDTSGSMDPDERLPLLRRAFARMVERLDERDRVAIVTYAGSSTIALRSTPGDDHRRILRALDRLDADGGTNGSGGIRTAYDLARREFIRDGQNRVILATDGDFNLGTTDNRELETLIRHEAADGVLLTVLGVGDSAAGDRRMEHLADCGNGVYAFLDDQRAADRALGTQLTANLVTVARDAKIQVFFNPAVVQSWRLIGYENRRLARRDFNDDRVDGGEVGAGHQVTALYEIATDGDANPFITEGNGRERIDGLCRLRLRWQPVGGGTSRLVEQDVSATLSPLDRETGWAAAIAAAGLRLRGERSMPWNDVLELAERCAVSDERREALDLLRRVTDYSAMR